MRRARLWQGCVSVSALPALLLVLVMMPAAGCSGSSGEDLQPGAAGEAPLAAIAVETFLADMARNVAGDKAEIDSLIPAGVDPHAFELTPADAVRVATCDVLILNGSGLEPFLEETVRSIGESVDVIEASAGLVSRATSEGEEESEDGAKAEEIGEHHHQGDDEHHLHGAGDPHYWLDPTLVVKYVENIREGLSKADPANAATYEANAAAYIESLRELDAWIEQQVAGIPPAQRLLVTNHESFGYYADRYGFRVVGSIIPGASANAAPSAQQLVRLVDLIRRTGVRAIFLETGSAPQLAQQLASETGVRVVTGLYSHSLSGADGPAPTYIDMMKANTLMTVEALR